MIKKIMFAAVSMSVLALHTQSASAQATPVYSSPAQAQTFNDATGALSAPRLNRVLQERRGFEPYAAAPRVNPFNQPTSWDKHTRDVSAY